MIERLSGADRLVLGADSIWPQDVGALAILDGKGLLDERGSLRVDAFRAALAGRLVRVQRFRQRVFRPRRGLGGPIWVDDASFDLANHIKVRALPDESQDDELLRTAEGIRRQRLNMARPPWEVWLMPGMSGGRIGLFLRFHHVIGDGRAALSTLRALVDTGPASMPDDAARWVPASPPSARALLADNVRRRLGALASGLSSLAHPRAWLRGLRASVPGTRELMAEAPGSNTSLNRVIGPDRRFAIIRDSLHDVRAIGRAHEATANDVLLAATSAGLRALLIRRGESVDDLTMRILVPVSLRGRLRGTVAGNQISQMVVPLPLGPTDSVERLSSDRGRDIHAQGPNAEPADAPLSIRRRAPPRAQGDRRPTGERHVRQPDRSAAPLYLAGARIMDLFPMLNLIGNQTIGVGVISYAGSFEICITADGDAVPDVEVVATGIRDELEALRVSPVRGIHLEQRTPLELARTGAGERGRESIRAHGTEREVPGGSRSTQHHAQPWP